MSEPKTIDNNHFNPPVGTKATERRHSSLRNKIIEGVKNIIALALPHLGK